MMEDYLFEVSSDIYHVEENVILAARELAVSSKENNTYSFGHP